MSAPHLNGEEEAYQWTNATAVARVQKAREAIRTIDQGNKPFNPHVAAALESLRQFVDQTERFYNRVVWGDENHHE